MKKMYLFIFLFLAAEAFSSENLTGFQIMQKMKHSNTIVSGLIIKGKIVLYNLKTEHQEIRHYISLTSKIRGTTKSLFRFTDSSYKGTTFLTIEQPDEKNRQYLFLPSIGSPRQVSASDKENNFLDTDIANEDLGSLSLNDYTYKRLPDKTINGIDCYVVARYPKNKKSKYSKHIMIIEKTHLLPLAAKSYGKDGRIIKRMKAENMMKISNHLYIMKNMTVIDISKKHKTSIVIESAEEKTINPGYFNKNRMGMHWQEQ